MTARPEQLIRHIRRLATASALSSESDAALLDHFLRRHDDESFAALVQRHGPMVLGVCRRILGNVHDAEDAFQATFLVLARKAATVQPRDALTAWLYGVARRVALKARTAQAKHTRGRRPLTTPTVDAHASPLDDLSSRELLAIFDEELQRLPRVYRLPLVLCCVEGRSQEEAARQLGWTPGSVKGRLERGRARLQSRLTRRGLMLSAALMLVEATRGALIAGLAETTIRASLQFVAGKGMASAAGALAEMALRGMSWNRSALWAVLMSFLLVVAGTGTLALRTLADKPPESEQPPVNTPEQQEPRRDRQGDPLPPGAIARLGTLRFRGVRGCLAYSPDGKLLAAATGEVGVYATIWEAATGRELRRIRCETSLTRLAFSPDGKRLACSEETQSHVFDVADGKKRYTVAGKHGAFADDGERLLTAVVFARVPRVRAWDAITGKTLPQVVEGRFDGLVVAADGRTMAVWNSSEEFGGAVQVVDLPKGKVIDTVRGGGWRGAALTPDGKTLAAASKDVVFLWDVAGRKQIRSWASSPQSPPVFSADGKQLAWIGRRNAGDNTSCLWTVAGEGDQPRIVGAAVNSMEPPCFAPDGKRLAVATADHILSVRNIADGKEAMPWQAHDGSIIDLTFSGDGRQVFSRAGNDLFVWQTRSGKLLRRLPFLLPGHEFVAPLLSGGFLLSRESTTDVATRGRFWLRDMRTGEAVVHFDGTPDVRISEKIGPAAVATTDHRYIALRGRTGEMCLMDVRNHRCLYRIPDSTTGAKLSDDGEILAWCSQLINRFEIHMRRRSTDKLLILDNLPKGDHWRRIFEEQPCLSPDGRWLVLPTEEGHLRRWDLTTGKEAAPLAEALRAAWKLSWSPDSRFVAVQGLALPPNAIDNSLGDKTRRDVRVWDLATGTRLRHLTQPTRGGECVLFSNDSRTLIVEDSQGHIRLWETATGQQRGRFQGHLWGAIATLALSPDGRMLASGGYDSQGFVWDLTGRMADGQWRLTRLSPEQRRADWEALAGSDARAAYRAVWQLSADPEGSLALLREQLRPVTRPKPEEVTRWLAALDSAEFAEREQAVHELEGAGETVVADLRRTLSSKPTLEVRRRIEALLERLDSPPRGSRLQTLRAVEVLEHIDTPQARALLRKLAVGVAGARLTVETQQALQRSQTRKTP